MSAPTSILRRERVAPPASPAPGVHVPAVAAGTSLSPRLEIMRGVALMVFAVTVVALLQLMVVGRVQNSAGQQRLYDLFRAELATGTAPLGATDSSGAALANGAPVAYLEIPAIGLKQIVVEGTTSSDLSAGPGHRRDTVLPGQFGVSEIFGRRAMYGGAFSSIRKLGKGDSITVITGQGSFIYVVLGVRRDGDPIPPELKAGGSRLTLTTAAGSPFLPDGVIRVDADLHGTAVRGGPRSVSASTLPGEEQPLVGDSATVWALVLWLQALLVVVTAAIWSWHRWGRPQTWVVFLPLLLLVGMCVWNQFGRLLPNIA